MTEYSDFQKEEMIGNDCGTLQFYEDENANYRLNFYNCIGQGGDFKRETFLRTKTNTFLAVFTTLSRLTIDKEEYYLVLISDYETIIKCDYYHNRTKITDDEKSSFQGIVGTHPEMEKIYKMIRLSADTDSNILILGESGTGKERIANAIHELSSRKDKPLIKVNCAALSENLLESELFGHAAGSFTGAIADKLGKFEAANNGTLFLDEIGEIPKSVQVKLLRVLQERTVERVGETISRKINIRIIVATNKNLKKEVEAGNFREDLYYRLNVFPIETLALKERKTDINLLVHHFIEKLNKKTGKKIKRISAEALKCLMEYEWPGNVRELENTIEYAFILAESTTIEQSDLPTEIRKIILPKKQSIESKSFISSRSISKEDLIDILETNEGSRKKTADYLNISTVALWKKMKKFELI